MITTLTIVVAFLIVYAISLGVRITKLERGKP